MPIENPTITLLKSSSVFSIGVTIEHGGNPYSADVVVTAHSTRGERSESDPILITDRASSNFVGLGPLVQSLLSKAAKTKLREHLSGDQLRSLCQDTDRVVSGGVLIPD